MSLNRRIFISAPRDVRLDPPRIAIKRAIVEEVRNAGYEPQIFLTPEGGEGLAAGAGWSIVEVDRVARRCVGAVLIGLPFWRSTLDDRDVWLPSDYCAYEGAVARTLGLPVLAISVGIEARGVFDDHAPVHTVSAPPQDDLSWLQSSRFRGPFARWARDVDDQRDVFLGYCSKSRETAERIQDQLREMGASVLNWEVDFRAGRSILGEIDNARARCSCGIFLFSEDDPLNGENGGVAPRDNVVFEAGYFIGLKGKRNVLIVRETGSKMPADLGGDIYAMLQDRSDIGPIERVVSGFMSAL